MNEPRVAGVRSRAGLDLFLISFTILFLELALIRWIPGCVRVISYFTNLVLIGAFLGTGLGVLATNRRFPWTRIFFGATLLIVGTAVLLSRVVVHTDNVSGEFMWAIYQDAGPQPVTLPLMPVAVGIFVLTILPFIALGQGLGQRFLQFRPLTAYSIDIAGSLTGVLAFGLLGHLGTGPILWFSVALAIYFVTLNSAWKERAIQATLAVATVAAILFVRPVDNEIWSPYYRIGLVEKEHRKTITVNGSLHQVMLDFDRAEENEFTRLTKEYFQIPYSLTPEPENVLILGAGSGNDVAMARRMGAKHIDAVEIDPVIQRLGSQHHFNEPYANDGVVTAYVDDARAFLQKTDRLYDLVILGTIDSQTLLSGYSSVRLDNFLYTQECFEAIQGHLKENGVVAVFHLSPRPAISGKIALAMASGLGQVPQVINFENGTLFNYLFLAGAPVPPATALPPHIDVSSSNRTPTDDWPFLYLESAALPLHYVGVLIAMLVIAVLGVRFIGERNTGGRFDFAMFFLGAGFLLVETKSVTEMSLLFGSTWVVNLVVFSAILAMILVGNLWTARRQTRSVVAPYIGLGISIVLAFAIPHAMLLSFPLGIRALGAGLIVGAPILFAAVVFARIFKHHAHPTTALASNLCGAMLGGTAEYAVMLTGIRSLYLVALVFYGASAFFIWRLQKAPATPTLETSAVEETAVEMEEELVSA